MKYYLIALQIIILFGCKKNDLALTETRSIDTLDLKIGDCTEAPDKSIICFDSVLNDSRCPKGAECCCIGDALIKISVIKDSTKYSVKLNTNMGSDTTINNLYLSMNKLDPYPDLMMASKPIYTTKLIVADLNKLKSNAKILRFSAEKCMCCWGWTIKTGNDTIMCPDGIIGQKVGYFLNYPVDVYVKLGEIEKNCSNMKRKYYHIKQIIKTR